MTRFVSVTSVPRFRLPVKNENKKQKKRPPPAGLRPRSGSERARGSPKRAGQKHRRIPVHGYFPGGDGRRAADGGEFFFVFLVFSRADIGTDQTIRNVRQGKVETCLNV